MARDGNPTQTIPLHRRGVTVLLIEDHLAEARLLQEVLRGALGDRFRLVHVKRLGEAIDEVGGDRFDVALLDLTLPDSYGLASLDGLIHHAPRLPIVVLTNTNDDELAVEAVRLGAQDYLVKRQITPDILVRSIRYAIERKQAAVALREANEILELRVRERTAELEAANQRLLQEVEHRQQVQERLELAQQAGKIGTFEWNIQTQTVTWSRELETLYGMAPGEFGGRYDDWLQTIHPGDRPQVEQDLHQAVQNGQGLNLEFRIVKPGQEHGWVTVKSSLFCDGAGAPWRMIGIHMDISEKKQLEAQFLRAQRLESLGTLASGIAHDLNNILTPVLGVVRLLPLKLPELDERSHQLLQMLETSARRGADLVKQILSFARGVEGKQVCLQVNHLLTEIEQIIRQTLPKSIEISTQLSPDLWTVTGDATQLHQVLMNLCVNARDAMPDGGTLSITAQNCPLDEAQARRYLDAVVAPYVVVTVTDTGTGIAPDILPRIFDPFFSTKEIGKGTGLGLSAVLGIVKSHGGFVDVQSTLHEGSQFQIFLPANQSPVFADQENGSSLWGQQELILVVDDEEAIREVTQATLEAYNYRVLTAENGVAAIALVDQFKDEIDGVVMDLMMPFMDGLAAASMIRQSHPHIGLIATSGLNSREAVAQATQIGVQTFLPKPFTTQEVLQALHDLQLAKSGD
ncbi:MAG: response regulator [Synechococcales bacterium]|nr:response regulator [Synechococcales bacterium]